MNLDLDGKVAIVTGAGGAICGEIAGAFAQEGVAVAIWDISLEAACRKRPPQLSPLLPSFAPSASTLIIAMFFISSRFSISFITVFSSSSFLMFTRGKSGLVFKNQSSILLITTHPLAIPSTLNVA